MAGETTQPLMPIYEYECSSGHISERVRKHAERMLPVVCHCGKGCRFVEISQPHCLPDGMYSYAPNVGSERAFERRQQALRDGVKVIKKDAD